MDQGPARACRHPRFLRQLFPRIIDQPRARTRHAAARACRSGGCPARPASRALLADRGLLKVGHRADIAIFDPADFRDRATYADPHQFPTGTRTTVIVNGALVVENAAHTGALPGQVLRRNEAGAVG